MKESAWNESNRLLKSGSSLEKSYQEAAVKRGRKIAAAMMEGYSRDEAEKLAGESTFGPRLNRMVDEFVADYLPDHMKEEVKR